jgi:hypothetical protein
MPAGRPSRARAPSAPRRSRPGRDWRTRSPWTPAVDGVELGKRPSRPSASSTPRRTRSASSSGRPRAGRPSPASSRTATPSRGGRSGLRRLRALRKGPQPEVREHVGLGPGARPRPRPRSPPQQPAQLRPCACDHAPIGLQRHGVRAERAAHALRERLRRVTVGGVARELRERAQRRDGDGLGVGVGDRRLGHRPVRADDAGTRGVRVVPAAAAVGARRASPAAPALRGSHAGPADEPAAALECGQQPGTGGCHASHSSLASASSPSAPSTTRNHTSSPRSRSSAARLRPRAAENPRSLSVADRRTSWRILPGSSSQTGSVRRPCRAASARRVARATSGGRAGPATR